MKPENLLAGLKLRPVVLNLDRHRVLPMVVNEAWCSVAACCEPGCGWLRPKVSGSERGDLAIAAKHHSDRTGHQTIAAWYAADRFVPALREDEPPLASGEPSKTPPSDSEAGAALQAPGYPRL